MGEVPARVFADNTEFRNQFRQLQIAVHETALSKGWYNPPKTFGEYLVLLHAEISEALEEYRNSHQPHEVYHVHPSQPFIEGADIHLVPGPQKPEGVPIELADLLIRLLDTCEYYNIDLIGAVLEKMQYNETRSYRHGGKVL